MPLPIYIICARSAEEDGTTKQLNFVHVVEGINIIPAPQGTEDAAASTMRIDTEELRVVASWLRGDDDLPTDEFEHQLFFYFPGAEGPIMSLINQFRFEFPVHRFGFEAGAVLSTFDSPGLLRIESKVRKVGTETCWSQTSYIRVMLVGEPSPTRASEASPAQHPAAQHSA